MADFPEIPVPDTGPLWTADELKKATKGKWLHKPSADWAPIRVTYDVSGKTPGHFCVLKSKTSWGRNSRETYLDLPRIVADGAAGAMIQRDMLRTLPKVPKEFPLLMVKDTKLGLKAVAEASRKRFKGKVVALTGTVGKTTSREMLAYLLHRQGGAESTRANNNNIAGVWRSMSYVPREYAYVALEMGFGFPTDGIRTSSVSVRPHVALLTNVSKAHLDVFTPQQHAENTPEELITMHKSFIFEGLEKGGAAVIGTDNPALSFATDKARKHSKNVYTYGDGDGADSTILAIDLQPTLSKVKASILGEEVEFEVHLPGRHMALNALGVLTCVKAAGGDVQRAAADFEGFRAVAGRSRLVEIPIGDGKGLFLDDHFNATPSSVASSLHALKTAARDFDGRLVAVLGEIGHMGPDEVKLHRDLAPMIVEAGIEKVFTWGPLMKPCFDALPEELRGVHTESVPELYKQVRAFLQPGDALTVKSGRGQGGLGDRRFRLFGKALEQGAAELKL